MGHFVQEARELGICLSDNDVLVKYSFFLHEELGEEPQSRVDEYAGMSRLVTLSHLYISTLETRRLY